MVATGGALSEETPDRLLAGLDLLAEASAVLLVETGSREILQAIARLCVDRWADYAAIYLRSAGSVPAVAAGEDPYLARLGLLPSDRAAKAARECGLLLTHLEPMVDAGRSIGTLALAFKEPRALDDAAHKIARTVSMIAGAAIVRAESNAARQRIVDRFQRALLPTRLPDVESIGLDAAYRPATEESAIGGDWYDAFDLSDARIGISVGDVAGHGLDAAVAMGEARRAIRMAAAAIRSPSELLNYANGILPLDEGVVMATAIAGYYDPAGLTFEYACAGHPPPIMVIGGRTHMLPGGGLPMGVSPDTASRNWTVTLPAGASIYFYTDGLLEYDRDIIAGENRLIEAIEATAAAHPPNAASALHDAIFATVDNTDDAATLVLSARGNSSDRIRLVYSSTPQFASILRGALRDFLASRNVEPETAAAIVYATGEAVSNAIEHGSHDEDDTFRITLDARDERLQIVVESAGHWKAFVPRKERGRGIPIMKALAKEIRINSAQNVTQVHLTFSLVPSKEDATGA
jgi:serine/threonine-protein kinase RsbW